MNTSPQAFERQVRSLEARCDAFHSARDEVLRWIGRGYSTDVMELLEDCDVDSALLGLIQRGLREPWSSDMRKDAETIVDALAEVEAERRAEG